VDKFVDDALTKENVTVVAQSNSEPTHIVSDTIPTNVVDQDDIPEIACPITPINNVTSKVPSDLPPIQKKTSKWDYLLRRDVSMHVHKLAEHYWLLTINDAISLGGSVNLIFIAIANKPRTYCKVLYFPYSSEWKCAIEAEYTQLLKAGVFEWVNELPAGKKAVGSRIVFKKKLDEHSNRVKFKAYIVAKDFSQVPSKDFSETFSSVAKFTTLWVFLALVAYLDFKIHQVDIVAAYLQGDLDEEIYMTIPEGVSKFGSGGQYWRLYKVLYGLKQAGRQ